MTTRRHIRKAVAQHARDRATMAPLLGRIPQRADYATAALPAHRGSRTGLAGYPGPGAVNAYRCKDCGQLTVVRHVDQGVTPMFLACRAGGDCQGMAVSGGYKADPATLPAPTFEWHLPDDAEVAKMSAQMQDHIRKGGLALRPVSPSDDGDALAEMVRDGQRLSLYDRDPERLQTALRNARSRRSEERRADGENA